MEPIVDALEADTVPTEVISAKGSPRRRVTQFDYHSRKRIVEEAYGTKRNIRNTARKYQVGPGQIIRWKRSIERLEEKFSSNPEALDKVMKLKRPGGGRTPLLSAENSARLLEFCERLERDRARITAQNLADELLRYEFGPNAVYGPNTMSLRAAQCRIWRWQKKNGKTNKA